MGSYTRGMGQQNGTAITSTAILEVTAWEFEPAQKLGGVVTNATGGFEGQIHGAISGKGKVTVQVPNNAGANSSPLLMDPTGIGSDVYLNLYADLNQNHGYQNILAALESAPVAIDLSSDKGVQITYNFKSNGPFKAIGMFNVLGVAYAGTGGSSSGN